VTEPAAARLLDLTRLVSRAARRPTGIDRVELAYLDAFLADSVPVFGLVRSAWGFLLLDHQGLTACRHRLAGQEPWGKPDMLSRLRPGLTHARQSAESDIRRLALARSLPSRLGKMLARHLPTGTVYVNVGHANLSDRVLHALRSECGVRIVVMIHDTIPLDFPQYQREQTPDTFLNMLKRVQRHAGLILCNSAQTRDDVTRHMQPFGPVPETLIAHLGVDVPIPASDPPFPSGFDSNRPCFITIGTIEPRKNHLFLLDLWAEMAATLPQEGMPQLLICGARGWKNREVFARLDQDPLMGRHVFEMPGLSDGQIAALLLRSRGGLFPSFAEGFGLPPAEALALGVPVICNSLWIYREILGHYPIYANVEDRYLWINKLEMLTTDQHDRQCAGSRFKPPLWQDHFNAVLSCL
jgi:glycosyltransferase involved in cell wall biosynthesis